MAREKKTDFDAEDFIESMRESAVPTYHRAPEKIAAEQEEVQTKSSNGSSPKSKKFGRAKSELEKKLEKINLSADEKTYLLNYVENRYRQVNRTGKQIYIREEYVRIIEQINTTLDIKISTAAYIDNVLADHFDKCYPVFQSIADKNPNPSNF